MFDWQDNGIVLALRIHGEGDVILSVLSEKYGKLAGLVRAGSQPKWRALLQPGNEVQFQWRARLSDHLGHFKIEPIVQHSGRWLDERSSLIIIAAASAEANVSLPERDPHPMAYHALLRLIKSLSGPDEFAAFALWESDLLTELGYGLDLSTCAVSGQSDDLTHVSPRTGKAVSKTIAEPYKDRLLPLPVFLRTGIGGMSIPPADILDGLSLTGYFLHHHAWQALTEAAKTPLIGARQRVIDLLRSRSRA